MGHIPRSLTVYLRGELTRSCEPGSLVTISGIFLPLPYSPQHQMRTGLITETYLDATVVMSHKKKYSDMETSEVMEVSQQATFFYNRPLHESVLNHAFIDSFA